MSDSPTLTIRGQRSDDWVDLYVWWSDSNLLENSLNVPYQSEDSFRDAINTIPANKYALIAEMSALSGRKQVVGLAHLIIHRPLRRRHSGEIAMTIHPDQRSTHTGAMLLDKVLDLAENWLGLHRLEVIVYADDTPILDLYEQQGFVREATLRHYAFGNGRYNDAVLLARLFEETL